MIAQRTRRPCYRRPLNACERITIQEFPDNVSSGSTAPVSALGIQVRSTLNFGHGQARPGRSRRAMNGRWAMAPPCGRYRSVRISKLPRGKARTGGRLSSARAAGSLVGLRHAVPFRHVPLLPLYSQGRSGQTPDAAKRMTGGARQRLVLRRSRTGNVSLPD